jgi:hypothetical protein
MDVTIIGTGNMARGIGTRVVTGGHGLTLEALGFLHMAIQGSLGTGFSTAVTVVAR